MRHLMIVLALFVVYTCAAQGPVTVNVPAGGSWLLTGGGPGQDDVPAPFLPALAILQTSETAASIRVTDASNRRVLEKLPIAARGQLVLEIREGERLLIDATDGSCQVTVTYVPVGTVLPQAPVRLERSLRSDK